jgi:hypothetical protein
MPDDPSLEREKWLADIELRKRELDIKEREQANHDAELRLKEREHQASTWRSPLVVAIFAASVAAFGNAVVAVVNGSLQRDVESSKAESVRILEMIRTGDEKRAAANLEFLLKSGLISDTTLATKLQSFLKTRQPGAGPALPSQGERVGYARSELLSEPVQNSLEATLSRYFEYLDRIGFPKQIAKVTVAVEDMGAPNALYFPADKQIKIDRRLVDDPSVALREYAHHVLIAPRTGDFPATRAIESGLADYFACSFLNNPKVGERAAKVLIGPSSPFLRNLENQDTYDRIPAKNEFAAGAVWGGFFWRLRSKLGADVADRLLVTAWTSFNPTGPATSIERTFLSSVLSAATQHGAETVNVVRSVAAARKLPMP